MKFNKLSLINFGPFEKTDLILNDKGLVSISGNNLDDPSAISNAAGKSTLLDALQWVLFGSTTHGMSGDEVIRWNSKNGCTVTLELSEGDISYRIGRNRKIKGVDKPNGCFVFQINPDGSEDNLTKGTDSLTQEVINNVIGCDENIFMSAIYIGQENMPDIPNMTDKEIKTLLEKASGLDALTEAYEVARFEYNEAVKNFNALDADKNSLERTISADKQRLKIYTEECLEILKSIENKKLERDTPPAKHIGDFNSVDEKITELQVELEGIWESIPKYKTKDDIEKMITEVQKLEQAVSENLKLILDGARRGYHEADLNFQKARDAVDRVEGEYLETSLSLDDARNLIGSNCNCCGQEITVGSIGHITDTLKIKKNKLSVDQEQARETLKRYKLVLVNAKSEYETAEINYNDHHSGTKSSSKSASLSNLLRRIKGLEDDIDNFTKQRGKIQYYIDEHKQIINRYINDLEEKYERNKEIAEEIKNKEIAPNLKKIKEKTIELEASAKEVEILEGVVKVFAPSGVRARVLDTITPFLNAKSSQYINKLSDGTLEIEWSTVKLKANGELTEKFTVVARKAGTDGSFKNLSGGQRKKVRLACALALHDLIAARAEKTLDLAIYDEIDSALDENGLERLMVILESKAREKGTILAISHNSLRDFIDNNAVVTLEGGIASVSGDLV